MPNGWMIYDGMWQTKFKFYPLDKATEAREGYIPAMAVFEIMDESVKQDFGDPNFDWRTFPTRRSSDLKHSRKSVV